MTKTITIYGVQILLGLVALTTGYAKLSGTGLMVAQFQALGVGPGFLVAAGAAEIVAGLCLLMPRGGILGALLLTCVMVGALGVTIGHVASSIAAPAHAAQFTSTSYQGLAQSGQHDAGMVQIVRKRTEWDIWRNRPAIPAGTLVGGVAQPAPGQPGAGSFLCYPDQSRA